MKVRKFNSLYMKIRKTHKDTSKYWFFNILLTDVMDDLDITDVQIRSSIRDFYKEDFNRYWIEVDNNKKFTIRDYYEQSYNRIIEQYGDNNE